MSEINFLISEKLEKYPPEVQKLIKKALELAEYNQATFVSESLEGYIRELIRQ